MASADETLGTSRHRGKTGQDLDPWQKGLRGESMIVLFPDKLTVISMAFSSAPHDKRMLQ